MRKYKILVLGGSGFVGGSLLPLLNTKEFKIIAPSHKAIDVTKQKQLGAFLKKDVSSVVINFVGYVNTSEAEKERGEKKGITWQLNVKAAGNVAKACREAGKFLIHISSDAVFPGTSNFPGPYREMFLAPQNFAYLSWYGYTKLLGENEVASILSDFAIVRLSYPFGNLDSERDFTKKLINLIKGGQPLFKNLEITPTFFPDLADVIEALIIKKEPGIYHVSCHNLTTIYEFAKYLAKTAKLKESVKGSILKVNSQTPGQIPRTRLGGLLTERTEKRLGLKFHSWQEALNQLYSRFPSKP